MLVTYYIEMLYDNIRVGAFFGVVYFMYNINQIFFNIVINFNCNKDWWPTSIKIIMSIIKTNNPSFLILSRKFEINEKCLYYLNLLT